jgi:hypothetical protein
MSYPHSVIKTVSDALLASRSHYLACEHRYSMLPRDYAEVTNLFQIRRVIIRRQPSELYTDFGLNRTNLKNWSLMTKPGFSPQKPVFRKTSPLSALSVFDLHGIPILAQSGATWKTIHFCRKPVSPIRAGFGKNISWIFTQYPGLYWTLTFVEIKGKNFLVSQGGPQGNRNWPPLGDALMDPRGWL